MDRYNFYLFCAWCEEKLDDYDLKLTKYSKIKKCSKCVDERTNELIEKKLKKKRFFRFDGYNCNDGYHSEAYCEGWDGIERRCECGNRRVKWEYDYDRDRVYGEAF